MPEINYNQIRQIPSTFLENTQNFFF